MPISANQNRFESDASRYAAYLATPEGRLRADLSFENLRHFLPASPQRGSQRALDLGGGTGSAAVRLAALGIHVTVLDSSAKMLELARGAIVDAGLSDQVVCKLGDATQLAGMFDPHSFDIVLCHNLLEYVDDPLAALRGIAGVMRDSSAILSVLVRNQAGEVVKAALQAGDLVAAERNLTGAWAQESLYGGQLRLFTPQALETALADAALTIKARRGVRVIADYLPQQISRSSEYERILALEHKLGWRQEFYGVARYLQCLACLERLAAVPK